MPRQEPLQSNRHNIRPTTLLTYEIDNYGAMLEERGTIHRWAVVDTGETYRDILAPKGKNFLFDSEDEAIHLHAMIDQVGVIEYVGPITVEQALGEIALRREAIEYQLEAYSATEASVSRSTVTVVIKDDIL